MFLCSVNCAIHSGESIKMRSVFTKL
jgi:hypothetical protein